MVINIDSTDQLPTVASKILDFAGSSRIFLFYGSMGAGKTTLIKSICACLGTKEHVTSPTFSIVNEYQGVEGKVFHFDFYRLKDQREALDMGYEEYFYSGNYCLIEWPEKIPDLFPEHYIKVTIDILTETSRRLTVEKI